MLIILWKSNEETGPDAVDLRSKMEHSLTIGAIMICGFALHRIKRIIAYSLRKLNNAIGVDYFFGSDRHDNEL